MNTHSEDYGVGSPIPRMGTVDGQENAERELRIAIGKLKAEHAKNGLEIPRILKVLREATDEEERMLATHQANLRSYGL